MDSILANNSLNEPLNFIITTPKSKTIYIHQIIFINKFFFILSSFKFKSSVAFNLVARLKFVFLSHVLIGYLCQKYSYFFTYYIILIIMNIMRTIQIYEFAIFNIFHKTILIPTPILFVPSRSASV